MKNRASLVLLEQLILVLVFALAATVCLGAFVKASQLSGEIARKDQAVVLVQNQAEHLKAASGQWPDEPIFYDENWHVTEDSGIYRLETQLQPTGIPGLGRAQVRMIHTEDWEILFSLTVSWQEVGQ